MNDHLNLKLLIFVGILQALRVQDLGNFELSPMLIQCSNLITLCLGSTGMDHVIYESGYKETILQKKYRKMTWSFFL